MLARPTPGISGDGSMTVSPNRATRDTQVSTSDTAMNACHHDGSDLE